MFCSLGLILFAILDRDLDFFFTNLTNSIIFGALFILMIYISKIGIKILF